MPPSQASQYQVAYQRFMFEEAKWLDSIVRPYVPKILVMVVEGLERSGRLRLIAFILHFLTDHIWIKSILRIKITRNVDRTALGGKGFRPGHGAMRLDRIRTTVMKGKKEIAQRAFPMGVIMS